MNDEMKCPQCGDEMQISTGPGRVRSYRGEGSYVIPADLEYPICRNCGAEWMTADQIDVLSDALEYQRRARNSLSNVVRSGVSFGEPIRRRPVSPEFTEAFREAGGRESLIDAMEGRPVGLWQKFKAWWRS